MTTRKLQAVAKEHGTPVVIIDHDVIRAELRRVQKASAQGAGVLRREGQSRNRRLCGRFTKAGASFDVASLPEFMLVYENIKHLPAKEQQDFIWDKIIYANPTKPKETLQALDQYKPLVTYDNLTELKKIEQFAPHAGVVLRLARAEHGLDGRAVVQIRL